MKKLLSHNATTDKQAILYLFLGILVFNLSVAFIMHFAKLDMGEDPLKGYGFAIDFLASVIFAPFLESIVFNILPIVILRYLWNNNAFVILIGALAFAFIHTYSIYYVLFAYVGGVTLNYFYVFVEKRKDFLVAGILLTLLHASFNLMSLIINLII